MKNKTRNKQTKKKSNNAGQRFWTTEGIRIKHSVSYFLSKLSSISTASLTYNKKHRSEIPSVKRAGGQERLQTGQ